MAPTLAAAGSAPVAKIVETFGNLLQSVQEETQKDMSNYKSAFGWCQESFSGRKDGQKQYQAIQNELESKLQVENAVNRQLQDEVLQLKQELSEAETAMKESGGLRKSEHGDYLSEQRNTE